MSVSSAVNRIDYIGDGSSTGPYAFSFPVYTKSDLAVYYTPANGTAVLKTLNTDYSQTAANVPGGTAGGSITLINVPSNLSTISLVRTVPYTQIISFTNLDKFDAKTAIEQAYDRAIMAAQQLYETLSRSLVVPVSEGALNPLPLKSLRANSLLGFDSSGQPVAATTLPGAVTISNGLWTPVLSAATPGDLAVGYTFRSGAWYKFDKMLWVTCQIITSSFTYTTASGSLIITGAPDGFVYNGNLPANVSGYQASTYNQFFVQEDGTGHFILLGQNKDGYSQLSITTNFPTTTNPIEIQFQGWYQVA